MATCILPKAAESAISFSMEAAKPAERIGVEDYLIGEQRSGVRHEFIDGVLYTGAGASDEHIALCL